MNFPQHIPPQHHPMTSALEYGPTPSSSALTSRSGVVMVLYVLGILIGFVSVMSLVQQFQNVDKTQGFRVTGYFGASDPAAQKALLAGTGVICLLLIGGSAAGLARLNAARWLVAIAALLLFAADAGNIVFQTMKLYQGNSEVALQIYTLRVASIAKLSPFAIICLVVLPRVRSAHPGGAS